MAYVSGKINDKNGITHIIRPVRIPTKHKGTLNKLVELERILEPDEDENAFKVIYNTLIDLAKREAEYGSVTSSAEAKDFLDYIFDDTNDKKASKAIINRYGVKLKG